MFAFGYFAVYTFYSGLTKALSSGILPVVDGPTSGFVLLPATTVTTSGTLLVFITLARGWHHLQRRRLLGLTLPTVRAATFLSGLATAIIIATTTLNYTFAGISILLALLLMRGGVLALAPLIDIIGRRRISIYSWAAMGLSFLAVAVALLEVDGYRMSWLASLNIAAYLVGYAIRLNLMTALAKSDEGVLNFRYFVEETAVAAVALIAIPVLFALLGQGEVADELRTGFTTFLGTKGAAPALLIGVLYACLYLFGTGIYLDARENTFCIPLNRCSSLLSGMVASYTLTVLLASKPPSTAQLSATAIILTALVFLMLATVRSSPPVRLRVVLFVCGGNTSRSPMAQAICNDEVRRAEELASWGIAADRIVAVSAGLTAQPGQPFSNPAKAALRQLGIEPHPHASLAVTTEMVRDAEVVFCMTEAQLQELIARYPEATAKIHCLDPVGDIPDPSGQNEEAYRTLAVLLQRLVGQRLFPAAA
jgi:protein-tyrosine-phosphatase